MSLQPYLNANKQCLTTLVNLLHHCTKELYTSTAEPSFSGCIGAHFRHTIEHYQCFIDQINTRCTINYDLRVRNINLENNPLIALESLRAILDQLPHLSFPSETISVQDDYSTFAMHSCVSRELSFLISHTQHHTAMIVAMLRLKGCAVYPEAGVSFATLNAAKRRCTA